MIDFDTKQFFDETSFKLAFDANLTKPWSRIVVDESFAERNEFTRCSKLRLISKHYMNAGFDHQALEVALAISRVSSQTEAFQYISSGYLLKNNFDSAIEVAKMIPLEYYKSSQLAYTAKTLAEKGWIEKANEVANGISNNYLQNLAKKAISKLFLLD